MRRGSSVKAQLQAWLLGHWWRPAPSWVGQLLRPLAWLYGVLLARQRRHPAAAPATPVPVLVVGNFVVGGAGKTPVVIALVLALRAAGRHPAVVSRGYGRQHDEPAEVLADSRPDDVGDEPLLIHRRTRVPVWVGRQRLAAARALCKQHPEVDVLVSDDGLQHRALGRVLELVVFDERGAGTGLLLPAGPLREPLPSWVHAGMRVLYSGQHPRVPLPGTDIHRQLGAAMELQPWWQGDTHREVVLSTLRGRRLLALAGVAAPEKFFGMLQAAGLDIEPWPQPDHARYDKLPWPDGTLEVITTEKDAVKLPPGACGDTRVWVVRLDLILPADLVNDVLRLLASAAAQEIAPHELAATPPGHSGANK